MARALRRVTVERGIDGRDCTLLAFGGGGPMHAAGLAMLYGIAEVVVPGASSAFSALGCFTADIASSSSRRAAALDGIDLAGCSARIGGLVDELRAAARQRGCRDGDRSSGGHDALCGAERRYSGAVRATAGSGRLRRDFRRGTTSCSGTRRARLRDRIHAGAGTRPSSDLLPAGRRGKAGAVGMRVCVLPACAVETAIVDREALAGTVGGAGHHRGCVVDDRRAARLAGEAGCGGEFVHGGAREEPLDPFVVEVVRHGLSAARGDEPGAGAVGAVAAAARGGDLSSAITDADGGLVAQGRDIPVHLGAMAYTVRELLKVVPRERLRPGTR